MTTQEIAMALVAMNREGKYHEIYETLYAPTAVSIENWDGTATAYEGLAAIGKKAAEWEASVETMHEVSCSEPLVADQSFAVAFTMDITFKDPNIGRSKMTELAVYTVADGKVVREEFRA